MILKLFNISEVLDGWKQRTDFFFDAPLYYLKIGQPAKLLVRIRDCLG